MKPAIIVVGIAVGVLVANLGDVHAQMFGSQARRGLASAKLGASGSSTDEMAGSVLHGNERFVRGNRRASDFVGSDVRDRKGFVGAQGGGTTRTVAPAVTAARLARPRRATNAPVPAINRATGTYQPRVAIGFETPQGAPDAISATVARQLAAIPGIHPADRIEVSVADGTATLRGVVVSERDRSLIAALLALEPGIWSVRNDLKVMPPQERSGGSLSSSLQTPVKPPTERSTLSPPRK